MPCGQPFHDPAESRYPPVEGEALTVVYALCQTRYYILGCEDLIIATDHKPLMKILDDRPLANITNRRLLNLKEKTLLYRFIMIHVSGLRNKGPDAASSCPAQAGEELQLPSEPPITPVSCEDLAHDAGTSSAACTDLNSVCKVVTWAMVREATTSDASMQQLVAAIQERSHTTCGPHPLNCDLTTGTVRACAVWTALY